MTVFNTFLKILNKNKFIIIMYTVILITFAGFNMKTSDNQLSFVSSKPDVLVINNDENIGLTKDLIEYINKNTNIIDIEDKKDNINDALFYREVNYIIYIPKNYRKDFLNGLNPKLKIKTTGDYQASLAEIILSRYIKLANIYLNINNNEDEIIKNINETLKSKTNISVTSKLDTNNLSKATYYYNFANYSILAGCVYVICLILSSFREEKIRKRTVISSTNMRKYNRCLMLSNSLLAIFLWLFYVLLSFIIVGNIMFSIHGLLYIINSFIFTICALSLAFLIGNIITNKNAINGIVNVVSLGSSFLCGAFVPIEYIPNSVLLIAHIFPSYWYIQNNEIIKTLEVVNIDTLKVIFINISVIIGFMMLFTIISNIISKRKTK